MNSNKELGKEIYEYLLAVRSSDHVRDLFQKNKVDLLTICNIGEYILKITPPNPKKVPVLVYGSPVVPFGHKIYYPSVVGANGDFKMVVYEDMTDFWGKNTTLNIADFITRDSFDKMKTPGKELGIISS